MNECPRLEIPGASVVMLAGKGDDGAEQATADVLTEIAQERRHQVTDHGYTDWDDDRWQPSTWAMLIHERVERGFSRLRGRSIEPNADYRQRLLEAAALCVAAVEALDRRIEQEGY